MISRPIRPLPRLIITGASGWMGRELSFRVGSGDSHTNVIGVGRKNQTLLLGGVTIPVVPWRSTELDTGEPTYIAHFAFVTREHLQDLGEVEYRRRNEQVRALLSDLVGRSNVQGILYASSGAAVVGGDDIYAKLKLDDEVFVQQLATAAGAPSVIARIWSVTGQFCTKPQHFLFFDLIRQTLDPYSSTVHIRGPRLARRRLMDAGDYLLAVYRMLLNGQSGIVDSGGDLFDSLSLAQKIQEVLGREKEITHPPFEWPPDDYYSDSPRIHQLARDTGTRLSSIAEQVKRGSLYWG